MNKLSIKFITYLLVLSFLSQNILWAGENRMLAPDSGKIMGELKGSVGKRPDKKWGVFEKGTKKSPRSNRETLNIIGHRIGLYLKETKHGARIMTTRIEDEQIKRFLIDAFRDYLTSDISDGIVTFDSIGEAIEDGCEQLIRQGCDFMKLKAWQDAEIAFSKILKVEPIFYTRLRALNGLIRLYTDWIEEIVDEDSPLALELLAKRQKVMDEKAILEGAMAFPAGINEKELMALWDYCGNFGIIEGIMGIERNRDEEEKRHFVYDIHKQENCRPNEIKDIKKFAELIERLNTLLAKLKYLPSDIKISLTSEGRYPFSYHIDNNTLEIHARLLMPDVDSLTLEFIARHDERHCIIEGLTLWEEELLNIYVDIIYLQNLGPKADEIVNSLRILEGDEGYWRILARRNEIFGSNVQQKEFLIDIIKHLRDFQPLLQIPEPQMTFESLLGDMQKPHDVLMTLWKLARTNHPIIFTGISQDYIPSPMEYLFLMARVTIKDLFLTKGWIEAERKILDMIAVGDDLIVIEPDITYTKIIVQRLWMNNKIEAIMYAPSERRYFSKQKTQQWLKEERLIKSYDEVNFKVVYIPKEMETKKWARDFIQYGEIGSLWAELFSEYERRRMEEIIKEIQGISKEKRMEIKLRKERKLGRELEILREIYTAAKSGLSRENLADNKINLGIALEMLNVDTDFWIICAVLVGGIDIKSFRKGIFSGGDTERLTDIIRRFKGIQPIPYLPLKDSRRSIQNHINLLIQLCTDLEGNPCFGVLLFMIFGELKKLESYIEKPGTYENLSEWEKDNLKDEIMGIYGPLSEFVGVENVTARLRDTWFKLTKPDIYEDINQKLIHTLRQENKTYEDLPEVLKDIEEVLQNELCKLDIGGVKIRTRVKSIYSIWEKLEAKKATYPNVESLDDLLGIQIIFPKSEIYKNKMDIIKGILNRVFTKMEKPEHRTAEQYGCEEDDFIGRTNKGSKIEVKIYPSEKDYRAYLLGRQAHPVYKLKRTYPNQVFDTGMIEQIQNKFTDDPEENFNILHNALSPWIFAGVVVEDKKDYDEKKVHIVRLPKDAVDADLASSRGVNKLDGEFLGVKDVTYLCLDNGKLLFPDIKLICRELKPGIYVIAKGADPNIKKGVDIFKGIKTRTKQIRTYLLVSKILDTALRKKARHDGKDLLARALLELGYPDRFLESKRGMNLMSPIVRDLGLENIDELYDLVYLVNKKEEGLWYSRVYKKLLHVLTGEITSKDIDDNKVCEKLEGIGLKVKGCVNPRITLVAYLITAKLRGAEVLLDHGIDYTNPEVRKKLALLLPEYGMSNLEQLYAKLDMYPDFIYNVLIKYSVTSQPVIQFKVMKDTPGIYSTVCEIMDREDVERGVPIEAGEEGELVSFPFSPPEVFTHSAISRILDGIKDIQGVRRESVEYCRLQSAKLVSKKIMITVPQNIDIFPVIAKLMNELGISFRLGEDEKLKNRLVKKVFIVTVPENISVDILETAIENKLKKSEIKSSDIVISSNAFIGLFSLSLFSVFKTPATNFYLSYFSYIIFFAVFLYLVWLVCAELRTGSYTKLIRDSWRKEIFRRFKEQLKKNKNMSRAAGIEYLYRKNKWLVQAFFSETVIENPNALLVDIKALKGLNEQGKQRLAELIKKAKERVVFICNDKIEKVDACQEIYNCLKDMPGFKKLSSGFFSNVRIRQDEREDIFVGNIYSEMQELFKVEPENIVIFTSKNDFVRLWHKIIRKSLFYIMDNDKLYITSEDLFAMQVIIGQKEFDLKPGVTVELLPEYYYTEEAMQELERREQEQGA